MPVGPAYWTDKLTDPQLAPGSSVFKRIAPGGPWSYVAHSWNGAKGVAAVWIDANGACTLDQYLPPKPCYDGLMYFANPLPQEQMAIGRRDYIPGIEYLTSRGINLTIPLAAGAASEVLFSSLTLGDPADEFAALANSIWERKDSVMVRDPELIRLIYLAIAQNYRVTQEMLDDLKWITSKDIDPIYCCVMGLDPKALADAAQQSPSPASASAGQN